MERTGTHPVDSQLAYVPIASPEGQSYLKAMAAAANFAFCNRCGCCWAYECAFCGKPLHEWPAEAVLPAAAPSSYCITLAPALQDSGDGLCPAGV